MKVLIFCLLALSVVLHGFGAIKTWRGELSAAVTLLSAIWLLLFALVVKIVVIGYLVQ